MEILRNNHYELEIFDNRILHQRIFILQETHRYHSIKLEYS